MKKILIIEDDQFVREDVCTLLELENFAVISAEDGETGIRLAINESPDLIMCDIMMPGIDGYEVYSRLRQHELVYQVPFIFLTAKADMIELRKGMSLGADDYITKPYDAKELIKAIKTRLTKNIKERNVLEEELLENNNKDSILSPGDQIYLPNGEEFYPVQVDEIECILAENVYSNVFTSNGQYIQVRKKLRDWDERLPEELFMRVHKSSIINLKKVKKVVKWFNNTLRVYMQTYEEPLTVSRKHTAEFKQKYIV